ncbi:MAG: hypothetical protein AB1918_01960 [Pseudomonadota bacterium]
MATLPRLEPSASSVVRLEGDDLARFHDMAKRAIEGPYTRPVGRAGYGDYAQVMVGGKVVATLSNEGFAQTSNALGAQLAGGLVSDGQGPALAQRRAEQIAAAVGGTVVMLETAMTQTEWNRRPALQTAIDFEAMEADGMLDNWRRAVSNLAMIGAQEIAERDTE